VSCCLLFVSESKCVHGTGGACGKLEKERRRGCLQNCERAKSGRPLSLSHPAHAMSTQPSPDAEPVTLEALRALDAHSAQGEAGRKVKRRGERMRLAEKKGERPPARSPGPSLPRPAHGAGSRERLADRRTG